MYDPSAPQIPFRSAAHLTELANRLYAQGVAFIVDRSRSLLIVLN